MLNAFRLQIVWRWLFLAAAALILMTTLASGHWFVDIVPSLPFAVALQTLFYGQGSGDRLCGQCRPHGGLDDGLEDKLIAPEQLAELLLPHLPPAVVRPIVTESIAEGRRGAAEMLREDGVDPPAGYVSWADHPWFNPILTEDEWIEREALAKAQVAGGDA